MPDPTKAPDEHHYGDGCPDTDAAHWRRLYEAICREDIRHRDQLAKLHRAHHQWEKDVYAAAKRQAWDDVLFNTGLCLKDAVASEIRNLAFGLESLPVVQQAARDLRQAVDRWRPETPDGLLAEVRRLRVAVYEQGRASHETHGTSAGEACRCPGCELTRAVELSGDESPDPGHVANIAEVYQ